MPHIERGPEYETAGEMYRRIKAEHQAAKGKKPFRKFLKGVAKGAMTGVAYNMMLGCYSDERAMTREDIASRHPDWSAEKIEERADTTMSRGMTRMGMMSAMRPGRPLPDTSHIREAGGMNGPSLG